MDSWAVEHHRSLLKNLVQGRLQKRLHRRQSRKERVLKLGALTSDGTLQQAAKIKRAYYPSQTRSNTDDPYFDDNSLEAPLVLQPPDMGSWEDITKTRGDNSFEQKLQIIFCSR